MGLIYLDTCVVIYAAEQDPKFGARVLAKLAAEPKAVFAVSPLVKLECLVGPIKQADLVLQTHYEALFSQLVMLPLNETVFTAAAHLRARFGLKTPDALHLACAQIHHCDSLWTNDDRLTQAGHGLAVHVLKSTTKTKS